MSELVYCGAVFLLALATALLLFQSRLLVGEPSPNLAQAPLDSEAFSALRLENKKLKEAIEGLERKLYLKELRSYRLSGLICNDHLDPDLPPVANEASFKCYTDDYKRSACMDGLVSSPNACASYNSATPYIPRGERPGGSQEDNDYRSECKESARS